MREILLDLIAQDYSKVKQLFSLLSFKIKGIIFKYNFEYKPTKR